MVTPHVQKRSNTSQRSSPGKKPKNNARPPIIVLDDEKEPIHDLVEPQVRSPTVPLSGVPGLNPSHLSFPRNCSNNIQSEFSKVTRGQLRSNMTNTKCDKPFKLVMVIKLIFTRNILNEVYLNF